MQTSFYDRHLPDDKHRQFTDIASPCESPKLPGAIDSIKSEQAEATATPDISEKVHSNPASKKRKRPDQRLQPVHVGDEIYLSVKQVAHRLSVSPQTIWRWRKEDADFPKSIELSPGTTRWRMTDLLAWESMRREKAQ